MQTAFFPPDSFNALNSPNFGTPNGIRFASNDSIKPDAANTGAIFGLRTPMRIIQFGLKFFF